MRSNAPKGEAGRQLTLSLCPLDSLSPYPRNPRRHPPHQIAKLVASIRAFGFVVPILVDRDGQIIAGHARMLAAQQVGLREVLVVQVEGLSPAQVRAFRVADNRLTEISTWDDRLLAETLQELSAMELDFSLEAIGFDMGEIDLRIESLNGTPVEPGADPADVFDVAVGPAVSRPGDLWQLDKHRVLCGNAVDTQSFELLMDSASASMVFTDPPYNVPIAGHVGGKGEIQHREFVMACGEMTRAQFTEFLTQALRNLAGASRPGSLHFVCMDWRHLDEISNAGQAVYGELKNLCVWDKGSAGMGSLYRSQHELIFVFKHGKQRHRNNVQLGVFGRHRSNVWCYPGVNSFARATDEGNLLALHPTVKPVALVADAILDCTARGDIVLDAFLGSGSTLIAAQRVGRRCYAVELDPLYVDTAIRRWQRFCGGEVRHAVDGQSFEAISEQRGGRHGK